MPRQISKPKKYGLKGKYEPNSSLERIVKRCQKEEVALTYDDVSTRARHSDVGPSDVDVSSFFSVHVPLKSPIVSAAMDSVTEKEMAIAIALEGGIGVIHRNLSPKEQAAEVSSVKHYLNALIEDPICFKPSDTVGYVHQSINEKGFNFTSFPVTDEKGHLLGLITGTHLKAYEFDSDTKLERIMNRLSRGEVTTAGPRTTLRGAYELMKKEIVKGLLLVDKKGIIKGMYTMKDVKRILFGSGGEKKPMHNTDPYGRLYAAAAVGTLGDRDVEERIELLIKKYADVIVIDQAHVNTDRAIETIRYIKKRYGDDVDVVAGNIDNPEAVRPLLRAGVDGIKIGIGPGSICTTRVIAGVGTSQFTAVAECAREAAYAVPVCADGGIQYSGDITKAIAAGAQSVMIGSLLAGTRESSAKTMKKGGEVQKVYRGMGSSSAMKEAIGSKERYDQDIEMEVVPQGIEGAVAYEGTSVAAVIYQLVGGLRDGMSYCGARNIVELHKKALFIRVTLSGSKEAHPHGVQAIKDEPNYPVRGGS